ncbi:MAG TPA: hypothetical protein VKH42_06060 [Vicinamibacterales bacterium]|nr:hypothetical protein [Vicinamibacterales bacterium]
MRTLLAIACAAAATVIVGAQQPAAQPPQPLPKGQMPDLGRPTRPGDVAPPLDFGEYFVGAWNFEWDTPDGPLGPSGRITGTTTYKKIDDRFFEADTKASGAFGAFTEHEVIAYSRDDRFVSRSVTNSRGYSYLQSAPVSGDAGGIYYIYLASSPFTYRGHTVRIKHNLRLLSPLNYRVAISVSDDAGSFVNYGNPWWRKDATSR